MVARIQVFKRFDYRVDWEKGYVWVMDMLAGAPVPPCVVEVKIEKAKLALTDAETFKAYAIEKAKDKARQEVQKFLDAEAAEIED